MFFLIITLIAVAIGGYVLMTSASFSGDAMTSGTTKAEVVRYKNEANQISNALQLYKFDNQGFPEGFTWQELVDKKYLKRLPQSKLSEQGEVVFSFGVRDNVIFLPNITDDVCVTANKMDGYQVQFGHDATNDTSFSGPNGLETSPSGFQNVVDDYYIPVCDDGLSDRVPCCYDDTPAG